MKRLTYVFWMRRALTLAARADNRVSPNPKVGCVIVKNNQLVGEGYHRVFGGPHAEKIALKKAGIHARGATVYVSLEPCVHSDKKTPPCVPALLQAGVKKVVVAVRDPNSEVSGRGIRALRRNKIAVKVGVLAREAKKINSPFFKWIKTGRPYVVLKMASTLDGCITLPGRKWISNESARAYVQRVRALADAILVGIGTVLADDPRLSCRIRGPKQPLRVILDSSLRLPLSARVLRDSNVLVATTEKASAQKITRLRQKGVGVVIFKNQINLSRLLAHLGQTGITTLLVEGGSQIASSFLREGLVDKAYFFVAPIIAGKGLPIFNDVKVLKFRRERVEAVGNNALFTADLVAAE